MQTDHQDNVHIKQQPCEDYVPRSRLGYTTCTDKSDILYGSIVFPNISFHINAILTKSANIIFFTYLCISLNIIIIIILLFIFFTGCNLTLQLVSRKQEFYTAMKMSDCTVLHVHEHVYWECDNCTQGQSCICY